MIILNNNVIDTNIEEATGLNNEHNNVDNIDIIKDAEIKVKTVSMKFTEKNIIKFIKKNFVFLFAPSNRFSTLNMIFFSFHIKCSFLL